MPSNVTRLAEWRALAQHHRSGASLDLRRLFGEDPGRFESFSLRHEGMLLDYSKNLVTRDTMRLLTALAQARGLPTAIERMFTGERVNTTEGRPALHIALRADHPVTVDGRDVVADVRSVLARMRHFCEGVRSGKLTGATGRAFSDVVNIGIGGSHLGPALACEALDAHASGAPQVHFVSNVDGALLSKVLSPLDPETTLFIIASKTFTTQETTINALSAREWLAAKLGSAESASRHFAAVTGDREKAASAGVLPDHTFEFWDWVGGRYSLWSSVGLPIALAVGMDRFEELLAGARSMDGHFRSTPLEYNMPVAMGLVEVWHADFCGARSRAVLPYDHRLRLLPDYLQQLEMESNGKRVTLAGTNVGCETAPVTWGGPGTNGQHAFYQMLHQGTQLVPADFIACCRPHHRLPRHHDVLLANFFAQPEALMRGRSADEVRRDMAEQGAPAAEIKRLLSHRICPGNRPSTSILLDELTPRTLGALIALYEHKVFVESVIWGNNAFDQWGVELGKQLADRILPELASGTSASGHDTSTAGLIRHYKDQR
jgi:glucose-6-phosphate isomerase